MPVPLDRFVQILVIVVLAAAATVWLGAVVAASFTLPYGLLMLIPTLIAAYVIWRVIADRAGSREDDHYDRME